ncbi:MAG: type 1 glutamine amidotransferase, partial [Gammaproteobacteria bacterium]|nr:type 1 glutamine amidotransferase [Gammaproteobacteria bacterium]
FEKLLDGHGFEFTTYAVVDNQFPADIHEQDGYVVSGSKHGIYEDWPFIPPLLDFIRQLAAANIPTVGICFGHQAIAKAMGARVEKYEGGWNVGVKHYNIEGFDATVPVSAWHQDQVLSVPDDAEIIASTEHCAIAGLRYQKATMLSLQPHPEFDEPYLAALGQYRADTLDDATREALLANIATETPNHQLGNTIAQFFKEHQETHA